METGGSKTLKLAVEPPGTPTGAAAVPRDRVGLSSTMSAVELPRIATSSPIRRTSARMPTLSVSASSRRDKEGSSPMPSSSSAYDLARTVSDDLKLSRDDLSIYEDAPSHSIGSPTGLSSPLAVLTSPGSLAVPSGILKATTPGVGATRTLPTFDDTGWEHKYFDFLELGLRFKLYNGLHFANPLTEFAVPCSRNILCFPVEKYTFKSTKPVEPGHIRKLSKLTSGSTRDSLSTVKKVHTNEFVTLIAKVNKAKKSVSSPTNSKGRTLTARIEHYVREGDACSVKLLHSVQIEEIVNVFEPYHENSDAAEGLSFVLETSNKESHLIEFSTLDEFRLMLETIEYLMQGFAHPGRIHGSFLDHSLCFHQGKVFLRAKMGLIVHKCYVMLFEQRLLFWTAIASKSTAKAEDVKTLSEFESKEPKDPKDIPLLPISTKSERLVPFLAIPTSVIGPITELFRESKELSESNSFLSKLSTGELSNSVQILFLNGFKVFDEEFLLLTFKHGSEKSRWMSAFKYCHPETEPPEASRRKSSRRSSEFAAARRKSSTDVASKARRRSSAGLSPSTKPAFDLYSEQKHFFHLFLNAFIGFDVISVTKLPGFKEWTDKSKLFLASRERVKIIDNCLADYLKIFNFTKELLKNSFLVCDDLDVSTASSTHNVSFSYPGFGSETFHIGRFSILTPWNLLDSSLSFPNYSAKQLKEGVDGNIGKELMQSFPDVNLLYESKESAKAKEITRKGCILQLRDLCLAYYVRKHHHDLYSKAVKTFTWKKVLGHKTHPPENEAALSEFPDFQFQFNPSLQQLEQLLEKYFSDAAVFPTQKVVFTQLRWLGMFRYCILKRLFVLKDLNGAMERWFSEKSKASKRFVAITGLSLMVREEIESLNALLLKIPKYSELRKHHLMTVEIYGESYSPLSRSQSRQSVSVSSRAAAT